MPNPLSMDLKERLISAVADGMSRRSVAKFFSVAPSTAIKWVDQKRRTGSVRPRPQGCRTCQANPSSDCGAKHDLASTLPPQHDKKTAHAAEPLCRIVTGKP